VTVVEVKSLTNANEAGQIRPGLGQILDYRHLLERAGETVRAVLAVEKEPTNPRWTDLCARHGAELVWPDCFAVLFEARA